MGGSPGKYRFCHLSYFYLCVGLILTVITVKCSAQLGFDAVAPAAFVNSVLVPYSPHFNNDGHNSYYLSRPYYMPVLRAQPATLDANRKDGKQPTPNLFLDTFLIRATGNSQCGTIGATESRFDEEVLQASGNEVSTVAEQLSPEDDAGLLTTLQVDFPNEGVAQSVFYASLGPPNVLSTKITFGKLTTKNEAPWQVAMFVGGKFHCGASIVGDQYILTAAHCVTAYKNRPTALKLSLGDWDLKTVTDGKHLEVEIQEIKVHPGFSYFSLQNDIAVLKLTKKITFDNRIRSVCLPPADLNVIGERLTVTGWGRNEKNVLQSKLQKLSAVAIENNNCADKWSRSGAPRSLIGAGTLCMDTQIGDSCKGDSGGPAVIEHPADSGKYVQVGIVSFGSGSCTDINLPGVYTRVAVFIKWITDNMN